MISAQSITADFPSFYVPINHPRVKEIEAWLKDHGMSAILPESLIVPDHYYISFGYRTNLAVIFKLTFHEDAA